ncbi:hypothetical protein [Pseudofrankia sp. BMG5.37]|uniref:hypothetical protein n=1 Tax=Pseudofrankia sp. BMG5.37 TaxID=3050035 RepID=UPI002895F2D4|nr:hypothetical protein [Pseudofrankia sp. BMG5.37]MDT3439044.1 hypothetical protein [Pseudofrankia sp. BMG5.37]
MPRTVFNPAPTEPAQSTSGGADDAVAGFVFDASGPEHRTDRNQTITAAGRRCFSQCAPEVTARVGTTKERDP